MPKYIGITIGPIHKTLLSAKKTREIWAASYIFSHIMKGIINLLKHKNEIIIPYINDRDVYESQQEAGFIHDRIIYKPSDIGMEDLYDKVITPVLYELSEDIKTVLEKGKDTKSVDIAGIRQYLNDYFNIYFCEIKSQDDLKEVNEQIDRYLDCLELQEKFIPENEINYLSFYFDRIKESSLFQRAFNKSKRAFPSIPEIAAKEFSDFDKHINIKDSKENKYDADDSDTYKQLKVKYGDRYKSYHKYIAIVQADGDNLGDTILSIKEPETFTALSKGLLSFSKSAYHKIKKYGGTTIYAGGDDLLFFAPMKNNNRTVFELCDELSSCFEEKMHILEDVEKISTLSFGMSISYYKYPMYEALEESYIRLKEYAKNIVGKNSLSFRCLKHSGTYFEGTISKNTNLYSVFTDFLKVESDNDTLTSVIHHFLQNQSVINLIANDRSRIENHFSKSFNEDIHKNHEHFFETIVDLTHTVYQCDKNGSSGINLIYSILRLKKFINGEADNE
jgi:CRISPR-associated protein Cmr2